MSTAILSQIDLNKIYRCMAVIPDGDMAQFSVSPDHIAQVFGAQQIGLKKSPLFHVFNNDDLTLAHSLLCSDTIPEEDADAAYRNALTCNHCAAETELCTCTEGQAERKAEYLSYDIIVIPF